MTLHRYYVPRDAASKFAVGEVVELGRDESHHAIKVLRESAGNSCIVFDGSGTEADAVFDDVGKRQSTVKIIRTAFAPRVENGLVELAIALPKGDRLKSVVERATELGVTRIVPTTCERSVKILASESVEKLERYVIESCKQCERNQLMEIAEPMTFEQYLESRFQNLSFTQSLKWIAHPPSRNLSPGDDRAIVSDDITSITNSICSDEDLVQKTSSKSILALIGPEGGFTDSEVMAAASFGWRTISLGQTILRVETAVSVIAVTARMLLNRQMSS